MKKWILIGAGLLILIMFILPLGYFLATGEFPEGYPIRVGEKKASEDTTGIGEKPTKEVVEKTPLYINKTTFGRITQDEIWRGEIRIVGDIIVEKGVTLTIEPGTKVLIAANQDAHNLLTEPFDMKQGINTGENIDGVHTGEPYRDEGNHISILVFGTLHAVGAPEKMITIISDSPKPSIYDWNSLQIFNGILSYAVVEYYRILDIKNGTVVSHNILRNVGECAVCANSLAVVENNNISKAGHELIDMHHSSPVIRNNQIGPNPNRSCVTIDGGSPQIVNNTIKGCGSGISFLIPPDDATIKDAIRRDNTFLNNLQDFWYEYLIQ